MSFTETESRTKRSVERCSPTNELIDLGQIISVNTEMWSGLEVCLRKPRTKGHIVLEIFIDENGNWTSCSEISGRKEATVVAGEELLNPETYRQYDKVFLRGPDSGFMTSEQMVYLRNLVPIIIRGSHIIGYARAYRLKDIEKGRVGGFSAHFSGSRQLAVFSWDQDIDNEVNREGTYLGSIRNLVEFKPEMIKKIR